MNLTQTTLSSAMFEKYGPVLTLVQLAQILGRSAHGFRITLRDNNPEAVQLNEAKLRIGRRIYFRTADVAQILEGAV